MKGGMDIGAILDFLPERYPLLLVDRILELQPGVRAVGLKNVTINEEFFLGHFPGQPVMPGVLILEALSQVGQVVLGSAAEAARRPRFRISRIEAARFRRPVIPGDALRLSVVAEAGNEGEFRLRGEAFVDDALAAEAVLIAVLTDGPP